MNTIDDVKLIIHNDIPEDLGKDVSKFQPNPLFDIHEFLKSWDDAEEEPPLAVTGNAIKFDSLSDVVAYLSKED